MRKLAASCESTYHLMKYLEPDVLHSDAIDLMYSKLVVLLNHLAEELKPLIAQQLHYHQHVHHFPVHSMSSASTPVDPLADVAMCGDLGYYAELLDQAAEFFSVRRQCRCLNQMSCAAALVLTLSLSLNARLAPSPNGRDVSLAGARNVATRLPLRTYASVANAAQRSSRARVYTCDSYSSCACSMVSSCVSMRLTIRCSRP